MNVSDIRRLYAYTEWANGRVLDAIAGLPEEQLAREIVSSFASIRDTVAHIAFAEWLWLQRFKGESPSSRPEWAAASGVHALREVMNATAGERRAFLEALPDEAVSSTLHYRNLQGDPYALPLGDLLVHCANHSTYHRGQLVTMLRQAGGVPKPTDFLEFVLSE